MSEHAIICALSDESSDSLQSHKVLSDYLNKNSIFSLREKENIVGFLIEQVIHDEAELIQIAVGRAYRKQGFAFETMKRWHSLLLGSGIKTIFLEVREDNFPAKVLYEKLGYRPIGRRKNYYKVDGKGHDAILMKVYL